MTIGRRAFLAGGLAVSSGAARQDPPAPLRIGVLRIRACFDRAQYARIAEALQELSRARDSLAAESEALRRKAETAGRDAEDLKGKRPDLQMEKLRLRGQAEGELKALQEAGRRRLLERAHDLDARIHREIRRVAALVAGDRGLQLVLRDDDPRSPLETDGPAPAADRATLLFHAPALDITPAVVERLNAEWNKAWSCATCRRKVTEEKCPDCASR